MRTPISTTTAAPGCIDHGKKGDKDGYTNVSRSGRSVALHRAIYCESRGIDLDAIAGRVVRHACDNPRCINPAHLDIGTHADNHRDMVVRGRRPLHTIPKLSDAEVRYIRANCKPSTRGKHSAASDKPFSYFALGKRFGVSKSVIARIHLGHTYRHVEPAVTTTGSDS